MKLQNLQQEFAQLLKKSGSKKNIYLVSSGSRDCDAANEILLPILLREEKRAGIYVTLNKGYIVIKQKLEQQGVDTPRLYFIDGISKAGQKQGKADNCTFLSGPDSLTELSLVITQAINSGKFDFLFFDSLSTLLMYHDLKTIEKFNHYLISKLREYGVDCILVSLRQEGEEAKLISTVSRFCDYSLDIEEG